MWLTQVRRTIVERGLFAPGSRVLVAISGGPDSAGLLLALATLAPELGLSLRAASVDHGVRPGSELDVEIARQQAAQVSVPFEATRLTLDAGPDLHARARAARYEALFSLARNVHAERVAVGHTRDDQAETVLARILRGASVRGLRGIRPDRGDGVVRPLIDVTRSEVHAAVGSAHWPVALDPSNELEDYQRVRIRRTALPALVTESAKLVTHLCDLADDAAQIMELLEAMATGIVQASRIEGESAFRIEPFRRAPSACRREALATAVEEVTGRRPFRPQMLELEKLLRGRGEVQLGAGWLARAETDRMRFERKPELSHPSDAGAPPETGPLGGEEP